MTDRCVYYLIFHRTLLKSVKSHSVLWLLTIFWDIWLFLSHLISFHGAWLISHLHIFDKTKHKALFFFNHFCFLIFFLLKSLTFPKQTNTQTSVAAFSLAIDIYFALSKFNLCISLLFRTHTFLCNAIWK